MAPSLLVISRISPVIALMLCLGWWVPLLSVKGSAAGSVLEDPDEDPGTYRPPPMHANKGKAKVCQNFEFHKQHNAYIRRL